MRRIFLQVLIHLGRNFPSVITIGSLPLFFPVMQAGDILRGQFESYKLERDLRKFGHIQAKIGFQSSDGSVMGVVMRRRIRRRNWGSFLKSGVDHDRHQWSTIQSWLVSDRSARVSWFYAYDTCNYQRITWLRSSPSNLFPNNSFVEVVLQCFRLIE